MEEKQRLIASLAKKRDYYTGSRMRRLLCHPFITIKSSLLGRITNRFTTPWNKTVPLFFGKQMAISLPPYLELLVAGAYASHDPEVRLTTYLINTLSEKDTFIDGGAHYGYYTLLAHHLGARTVSIEPSPLVLPYLRENVAAITSNVLHEVGISDTNGTASFYESDIQYSVISTLNPTNLSQIDHLGGIAREVTVKTATLDSLLATESPTMLKLDIEGAEAAALRGAERLLTTTRPRIAIEVFLKLTDNDREALRLLQSHGYTLHAITAEGSLTPIAYDAIEQHCEKQRAAYRRIGDDAIIDNLIALPA